MQLCYLTMEYPHHKLSVLSCRRKYPCISLGRPCLLLYFPWATCKLKGIELNHLLRVPDPYYEISLSQYEKKVITKSKANLQIEISILDDTKWFHIHTFSESNSNFSEVSVLLLVRSWCLHCYSWVFLLQFPKIHIEWFPCHLWIQQQFFF